MSKIYSGSITCWDFPCDLTRIEELLEFEPETIEEVVFNIDVHVSGKFIEQTFYEPAEYPEVDDINLIGVDILLYDGTMIVLNSNKLQALQEFIPEDDSFYWELDFVGISDEDEDDYRY